MHTHRKGQSCQCHLVISSNSGEQHRAVSLQQPVPPSPTAPSSLVFTITLRPSHRLPFCSVLSASVSVCICWAKVKKKRSKDGKYI